MLRHCARILKIDILWCDPHILECGLDVGVTHQSHERRQAHTRAYHIRGKGVSKTMRMGELNPGGLTMVAEQGTQSRSVHACSACAPFQNDKQRGTAGAWTFELQIVIEQLNSFWRQGKEAKFVAFSREHEVALREATHLRHSRPVLRRTEAHAGASNPPLLSRGNCENWTRNAPLHSPRGARCYV